MSSARAKWLVWANELTNNRKNPEGGYTTMTATTTIQQPRAKDKVRVTIEGEYAKDAYGDTYVMDESGNRIYLNTTSMKKAAKIEVTSRHVPEPTLFGTIISVDGDKYQLRSDKKWHYLSGAHNYSETTRYTFDELVRSPWVGLDCSGVMAVVPFSYEKKDLAKWHSYDTDSKGIRSFRVDSSGRLEDEFSAKLTRQASIQLARDVLRANSLSA